MRRILLLRTLVFCLVLVACQAGLGQTGNGLARDKTDAGLKCLPTGVCIDAAGPSYAVGNMPLSMTRTPEGDRLVVSLSGWREQGLQIVEISTGKIVQQIPLKAAFLGVAFSPDGKTLYSS